MLFDGDGKVPDDARVGVVERVRNAEQGRRLAQRLPVAFFQGVETGVPTRGPCLAVVAGEQGDPRAVVLVDVQAEIFLNEAHTDFMVPLAAFGEPDVVQLRREVEPVPPDVVEPVELGEILKQGRGDGGYTLPMRQRIDHGRRFGHDRRGEGRFPAAFHRFGGRGGTGFRARFGAGGGQGRGGGIGFWGGCGCGFRGGFLVCGLRLNGFRLPAGLRGRFGLRLSGGNGFRRPCGPLLRGRLRLLQLVFRMYGHDFFLLGV